MRFGNPQNFYLFLLFPVMIFVLFYGLSKKKASLQRFADETLLPRIVSGYSSLRYNIKAGMFVAALFFLVVCLLGPRWGFHWEEVKRRGVDIVIALDTSKSMLSQDVKPNRFERARREVYDLIHMLKGDRVGLVVFSGGAFLQCPLTLDYGACLMLLDFIDTNVVPQEGTMLAGAIRKSVEAFDDEARSAKAIVLISDGGNLEGDPLAAANEAKKKEIKIYTIGIGREDEEVPIPLDVGGFKYSEGKMVTTKLESDVLQRIADATDGVYVRSVTGDLDLDKIYYEEIHKKMEKREIESTRRKRWEERFQWPLIAGIVLLFAEAIVGERRKDAAG